MPGDHENVVKLNADHRGVCKFGPSLDDQDNFKLVRSNIKDLYTNALKTCELRIIPFVISLVQRKHVNDDNGLQAR